MGGENTVVRGGTLTWRSVASDERSKMRKSSFVYGDSRRFEGWKPVAKEEVTVHGSRGKTTESATGTVILALFASVFIGRTDAT